MIIACGSVREWRDSLLVADLFVCPLNQLNNVCFKGLDWSTLTPGCSCRDEV